MIEKVATAFSGFAARSACLVLVAVAAALLPQSSLGASTVYWDANSTTGGACPSGNTAPGTWGTDSFWSTSSAGTAATAAWTSGDTAFFSAGTDASGAFGVTLNGAQTAGGLTFEEGTVTLSGSGLTLNAANVAVNSGAKGIISSVVSGSVGLTKSASGELVLGGANDFSGNLTLLRGTLTLNNNSAASSGTITINNSSTAGGGNGTAALRTDQSVTLGNAISLGPTGTQQLDFGAASGQTLTLNGLISGSHPWSANGTGGTVILGGTSANTFISLLTVAQGTLVAAKDQALGTTDKGTTVNSGATLGFQGDIWYQTPEAVTINGLGVGSVGAINNVSGDNEFDGAVTLSSASSIGAAAGGLAIVGPVNGSYALTKVGAGYIDLWGENNNYTTTLISEGTLGVWDVANAGTGLATVSAGARLEGNGSVPGGINLSGTISPGASPDFLDSGSQTWNGGATYQWEINSVAGDAGGDIDGYGWDLLNITGGLTIGATSSSQFTLKIISLALDNSAGAVVDFDNTQEYNWTIAATSTGVSSFDATAFTLDDSNFSNDKGGGRFVILTSGNNLVLRFDPKPVIICPANITQGNDSDVCGATISFAASATDNQPGVTIAYKIGLTPITSPHLFPVGTATVDATATDSVGNTDTCSFTVTVNDTQNPTITAPSALADVPTDSGACTTAKANVSLGTPVTGDNCGVAGWVNNAPDPFPKGTTVVTWTVTDTSGNTATATQSVTVKDHENPVAQSKNITRSLALNGSVSITAADVDNGSSDNCHIASMSVAPNSWNCSVGDKAVTLTVTDDAGNTHSAPATVTLSTPPYAPAPHFGQPDIALANPKTDTITDVTLNVGQNLGDSLAKTIVITIPAGFQFGEPAGVGAGVELGFGGYPGSPNRFRVRTTATQNEWEIYDTQSSHVSMFVHVVPNTSMTVEVNPATMPGCLEQYTWDLAVTIKGSITQGTINKTASACQSYNFPIAFTSYFDQVVNRTGTVTLTDGTAPVAICKNITVQLDANGQASITPGDVFQSGSDNCGTVNLVSVVPSSFTYCNLGANTVALTVNDGNGNTAACNATVTITAPANPPTVVYVDDDYGTTCAEVTWPASGGSGPYYVNYNAFNTIQAAVNAAASGGTVNVAAGTYRERVVLNKSVTVTGDPGSLTVAGPGPNAPILDGDLDNNGSPDKGDGFTIPRNTALSGITVEGFIIRNFANGGGGNGVGVGVISWENTSSHVTIRDNQFQNLGYNGIYVGTDSDDMQSYWLIQRNIVEGAPYAGIELTDVTDSQVLDNVITAPATIFSDPGDAGVGIEIAARARVGTVTTANVLVQGNTISGTFASGSRAGINLLARSYDSGSTSATLSGVTVQDNAVTGTGTSGIKVVAESRNGKPSRIEHLTITENTLTGNAKAIQVGDSFTAPKANGTYDVATITIEENSVVGNAFDLSNLTTVTVKAERNYWGSVVASEIAPKMSVAVDWNPWCNSDFTDCTFAWAVHNLTKSTDHPTIQSAIDAAGAGDAIAADAGTYPEHVVINKAVTVTGAAGAVIDGGNTGTVVDITASGATLEGLTVQHSGTGGTDAGVKLSSVSGCTVRSLTVANNAHGIVVVTASGNFLTSNAVNNNAGYGIAVVAGTGNTINLNTVTGNGLDAIALDNANMVGGPVTMGSTGNFIKGNSISSGRDGIFLGENCDNNQVTDGNQITSAVGIGVSCWRSDGQTITDNVISGASPGIRLLGSSNNTITGNDITGNTAQGIKVDASYQVGVWYQSANNTVRNNNLSANTTAILCGAEQTDVVNASGNWWGSAVPATVKAAANGGTKVDYTPWLAADTDTDGGAIGFKGDFVMLWVDDDSPQVGSTGRIQEGIDSVTTGGTVNVAAGTFTENVTVPKKISLVGSGSGSNPASDTILAGGSAPAIVLTAGGDAAADRLRIASLRLTGSSDGVRIDSAISYITLDTVAASCNYGLEIHNSANITDLKLTGCLFDNCSVGIRKATSGRITGLLVEDSTFSGGTFGINVAQASSGTPATAFSSVTIRGSTFQNISSKGIYVEALSDALFECNTFNSCGTAGSWAAGIDVNLKYAAYQNVQILNSEFTACGNGDLVNGAGITIKARDDGSYASLPATLTGVTLSGLNVNGCPDGVRFGEPGKNNAGPTSVTVHNCNLELNVKGIRNESLALTVADLNWWGNLTGPAIVSNPGGSGVGVSANVDFSPWLGSLVDLNSGCGGFQPDPATPQYHLPSALVFTTQPGGANLGDLLSPQPVVEVRGDNGLVASQYNGPVTLSIGVNPDGGVLTGTLTRDAVNGVVNTFDDLRITVGGGSGYKLQAAVDATPALTALSDPFNIANPETTISSLSPFWIRAGSADFTLEVMGTGFVPDSKIWWNGAERATTFVSATKLTTLITTAEIGTPGSVPVKVVTPAPGGGTTAELTFRIEAATPTVVYVDDSYGSLPNDTLVDWPCPTGTCPGTQIIGYDAFAALPDGVSAVAPGGTVLVAAGSYTGIVGSKDFALVNEVGVVISGASPALVINSGSITVTGGTLTTATADPTILVAGGSLALRNAVVKESTGSDQAAISVTSGTLDLGTTPSNGGNTININGAGSLLSNTGANPISAIGNTWQQDSAAITSNYGIEDEIYHPLDAGNTTAGLVTWVANNAYVSTTSGSIQRGVNAVTAGDTVNVVAATFGEAVTLNKRVIVQGAGKTATTITQGLLMNAADGSERMELRDLSVIATTSPYIVDTTYAIRIDASSGNTAPVTLQNVKARSPLSASYVYGAGIFITPNGNVVDDVIISGCTVNDSWTHGMFIKNSSGTAGSVTGLAVNGSTFDSNTAKGGTGDYGFGLYILAANANPSLIVSGVTFTNCSFNNNYRKGMYVESLANVSFDQVTATGNGREGIDLNLKWDNYAGFSFTQCTLTNNSVSAGGYPDLHIKGRNDGGTYSLNPGSVSDVSVSQSFVVSASFGNNFLTAPEIQLCSLGAVVNYTTTSVSVDAENNWWGSPQGPTIVSNPGGNGAPVSANVDFSPWLGDGTDTQPTVAGFQPKLTPVYYTPTTLVFSTQPGGADLGALLSPQPVVQVKGEDGNVAVQYQGPVTLSIGVNPDGGVLAYTAPVNAVNGIATFTDVKINTGGGSGYKLLATVAATPALTVLSDPFDIANPAPVLAGISPIWKAAGSGDFTLTLNGSGFVPDSKVMWGTSEKTPVTFAENQLTVLIPAADIATAGTVAVAVVTPAPGGGTSAAHTFTITETAIPPVVWVDDNWDGPANSGGHVWGYDAFATVQTGVNGVAANGTVNVLAGNYVESPTVTTKELDLLGVTDVDGKPLPTIRGKLTIVHEGSDTDWRIENINFIADTGTDKLLSVKGVKKFAVKNCTFDGAGRFVTTPFVNGLSFESSSNGNDDPSIEDCVFKNGLYSAITGIAVNLAVKGCVIENVKSGFNSRGQNLVIQDTDISVVAQDGGDSYGVRFGTTDAGSGNGLTLIGCAISVNKNGQTPTPGNYHCAIYIRSGAIGTLKVNNCSIGGEVVNLSSPAVTLDASGNWWGSAVAATVKTAANGGTLVDYTPWLAIGTDTDGGAVGFKGNFSTLWVDDDSLQVGTPGRIQEAVNLVSGSTVNVVAGLYLESNILVGNSMTIQGMGATRDDVVVAPAAEDGNADSAFGTSAQNGFIIRASDVTITKLTLDGRGNTTLTPGKNNFRTGIVSADASYPGGGGGTWNNLHVDDVQIKYPYRRGISVYPLTVSGTVIENSRVEGVAFNHGMYVAGLSQVLNNTVHHAFQGIVLALDPTTPAGLCKVNGNTLTDIGNSPGCWGYNSGDGSYAGQPRGIQFNNSDSAGRPVEIKDNTISDNGLEQYSGAVGIYTRLANSDSLVEGNVITLTSGVSWADPGSQAVGMLLGWSYANGFTVKNNHVSSTKYGIGVMIFGNGTAAKPLILEGNTITSTASAARDTGDGTGIYIANQYLFAGDKNPSYVILQNANTVSGFVTGVGVEKIPTSTEALSVIAQGNAITANAVGVNVAGDVSKAMIQNNDLTANTVAAIRARNAAIVDAGDCAGGNVTGLGSSAGGNNLTGYGFDNAAAWAIDDQNTSSQPNVLAQKNNFGAQANVKDVVYDGQDSAGANSLVFYSQSGAVYLACPGGLGGYQCAPGDAPPAASDLAAFLSMGGVASATAGALSHSDGAPVRIGPGNYTVTRTYTLIDVCNAAISGACDQAITFQDTTPPTIGACPASFISPTPTISYTLPTASDNCAYGVTVTGDPAPGSTLTPGVHTVTCTATDDAGLTDTCSFQVVVPSTTLADAYVDDDYAGLAPGTAVTWPRTGGSGTYSIGYDAFATVQGGVGAVAAGGTVHVAAGSYAGGVVVSQQITLNGAKAGVSACGRSGGADESTIVNAAGIALDVQVDGVVVDGFALQGITGIKAHSVKGFTLQNNLVTAAALGMDIENIVGTGTPAFTVATNKVVLTAQEVAGTPTAGIVLAALTGTAPTVQDNCIANAFGGYALYAVVTTPALTIKGGTISGVLQGVDVLNVDPTTGTIYAPSTFTVDGVAMSAFAGTSSDPNRNFHAGVYVFTGGSDTAKKITGTVRNVSVSGTGKPGADSAGLYFGDFSTASGEMQNIAVETCSLQNNLNRGVYARGAHATVAISKSHIENNGSDPYGTGGNHGFGVMVRQGATVSLQQTFVVNPASVTSPYTVNALSADSSTLTVSNCSIDNNGTTSHYLANGTLNASGNWWSATDDTTIAGLITGTVDFTPYLDVGTDVGGDPADGFQGNFSTLHVTMLGAQTGSTGRIQEGNDLVSGSTVIVENGLYKESNTTITKSLLLIGESRTGAVIAPAAEDTGDGWSKTAGSPQNGLIIQVSGVTIRTLTVDGSANNLAQGGSLPNHYNFRHGIRIADGVDYKNVTVDDVNVFNIRRRGIFLFPTTGYAGPYVVNNCTVNHVEYQNAISIGSANATVTANTLDDVNNAISVHHSASAVAGVTTTITGNIITGLGHVRHAEVYPPTGIYYRNPNDDRKVIIENNSITAANNVAAPIGFYIYNADNQSRIANNQVNFSTLTTIDPNVPSGGTYGDFAWSYPLGLYLGGCAGATVQDNSFTLIGIGSGIYLGRGVAGVPVPNQILHNNLTTTLAASTALGQSYGIASSDDPNFDVIGESQFNTSNLIKQNTISGFVRGILLQDVNTYTVSATISDNNTISGSTTFAGETCGIQILGAQAIIKDNLASITGNAVGVDVNGGKAMIQNNTLTANTVAAIRAQNGAIVDAGQCATGGSDVTGLGISTGGNVLTLYDFDNAAPWAVENLNGGTPVVLAYQNSYGAIAGDNVAALMSGPVAFSQSGGVLVTCPPAVAVQCPGDIPAAATDLAGFLAQGGTVSCSPATVAALDTAHPASDGSVTRTYTITDACGAVATCDQTITVDDTAAPVITCPPNVTVNRLDATDPYATGTATATDNCTTSPAITYTDDRAGLTGCNATGNLLRTWKATDASGLDSTCVQTITIQDTLPPVVTVPANITVNAAAGQCSQVVTFAPTAADAGYFQGFEDAAWIGGAFPNAPSVDWNEYNSRIYRVTSGTDGITDKPGSTAHAVIDSTVLPPSPDDYTGVFGRLGGYYGAFGTGFRSSVDVYLDMSDPAVDANTYGFDVDTAASTQSAGFLRDFIFHVASATGPKKILVAASNNSNFARRNDLATINHYEVTASGWYTFEWVFRDNAGVLAVDCNLRDDAGTLLWTETRSAPADLIASVVGGNRYMWFTFVAADKLAIDNTTLERNAPVVSVDPSGSSFPVGVTTVNCTAKDACGNTGNNSFTVTVVDNQPPVITGITATEVQPNVALPVDVKNCANSAVQGTVKIAVTATDQCSLAAQPVTVTLVNGANTEQATFIDQNPSGTFNFEWIVTETTAEGTWDATAVASDTGGGTPATFTVCVDKSQVAGLVTLEGFQGTTRAVTFVATDGAGAGATVLKTWTLTLNFNNTTDASYVLTGVPAGTLGLSAKTDWNLRRKLPVTLDGNGQATINFNGTSLLKGGDIGGPPIPTGPPDNEVNLADYQSLLIGWLLPDEVADITGDGWVNIFDYAILAGNWYTDGEPQ